VIRGVARWRVGLGLVIAVGTGTGSAQELSFVAARSLELSGTPVDILIADNNEDLRPDVFVTIVNRATVGVLTNGGEAGLGPAVYTAAPFNPNRMASGDFDADGRMDLIVTEGESDFVYFKQGLDEEEFAFPERVDADHDPYDVDAADMNGDGVLDLVTCTAAEAGGEANVLLGQGDGTFDYDPERARRLSTRAFDVETADIDGDGILDAVVAIQDGNVGILRGDGTGGLDRVVLVPAGMQLFDVALADLDGDGAIDIVAADAGASGLRALLGDGEGGFGAAVFYPVVGGIATVRLVDVNGDGLLDAITSSPASGTVGVLPGGGDGTFGPIRSYLAPSRPFVADAVDLDEDGHVDLIGASQVEGGGALNVIRGSTDGFAGIEAILQSSQPAEILARDLDGDGLPELVMASGVNDAIVSVARDSNGGFLARRDLVSASEVKALQVGDVDGDGRLDIVAATDGGSSLVIAFGQPDGTFAAAAAIALNWPVESLALGDLDGDGLLDIATRADQGATSMVMIFYGAADGLFSESVELPIEGLPLAVDVVDLDGDGHLDILANNATRSEVTLFAGNGTREWAPSTAIATAFAPAALAWGDLDGDGAIDLVYGGLSSVRTLFADGAGAFTNGAALSVPGSVAALAVRDLTGDLRPDIAAVSQTAGAMVAYASTGSRFDFGTPLTVALGQNPTELVSADLDGDGRYDTTAVGGAVWAMTNDGASPAIRGDANGDDRVGAADVTALSSVHTKGTRLPVESAGPSASAGIDANGDGWIDDDDPGILLRRIFAED